MTEKSDPNLRDENRGDTAQARNAQTDIVTNSPLDPLRVFLRKRANQTNNQVTARVQTDALLPQNQLWETQGLLWVGFAVASGIFIHGVLLEEPYWPFAVAILAILSAVGFNRWRKHGLSRMGVLALAVFAGVTLATVRTAMVEAPKLAEEMSVTLTGRVLSVDQRNSGKRVLLKVLSVNNRSISTIEFPEKARMRVPTTSTIQTGEGIEVRGRLFPPAGPVTPGGYDFSYRAYYSKIGATGFAYGVPKHIDLEIGSIAIRFAQFLAKLRDRLAARITANLADGPEAALAVALLVGERSGITPEDEENLRQAGLAHILAISGLHMALFAGGAFSVCLAVLALVPAVALRIPIHKVAAVSALMAAVVYLLLSGASVATQRSFLMIALVFLGLIVGRRGLTLRSVAIAGLFLLVLAPERLFFPGFQMSFAAVIALIAVYDIWRKRPPADRFASGNDAVWYRLGKNLTGWVAGLFVTALVAGLATGIIGAHHFARIAPYGLIGNMLGMPVFSLIVMPMGVLALALMPFGLAAIPLTVMAFGLSLLLDIAAFTAGLTGTAAQIGILSAPAALLLIAGLFALLLLPGRLRAMSLVPVVLGTLLVKMERPPDIQIAASGSQLAARDETGLLRLTSQSGSFQNAIWLQTEGIAEEAIKSRTMKSSQKKCDKTGCVVFAFPEKSALGPSPTPLKIAIPKTIQALGLDCRKADIVVSDKVARGNCVAPIIIDKNIRKSRGTISIWLSAAYQSEPQQSEDQKTALLQSNYVAIKRTFKPVISRISYAIPKTPRPWHRPGTVTRRSLSKSKK